MTAAWKVRVLGPIDAVSESSTFVPTGQVARLLGLLAMHRQEAVDDERLSSELWNDERPRTWESAFRTFLAKLHAGMPGTSLRSKTMFRLAPEHVDCDADDFLRRLHEARRLSFDDPGQAIPLYEAALGLWRGDPYQGLDLPALLFEREQLVEARETALEEVAGLRLRRGNPAGIVAELRRLAREKPHREVRTELLMRALVASGRRTEALRAYHDLHRYLGEEFGVEPGATVVALERSIAAEEPVPVLNAVSYERQARLFVGRERLRARLGQPVPFRVVLGEAGIGKTAFAEVLADDFRRNGVQVWTSICAPRPFSAFSTNFGVDTNTADHRIGAVAAAIAELIGGGPAVVILDDAHEADVLSQRVIGTLLETAPSISFVAFARPDSGSSWAVSLAAGEIGRLEPFTLDEVRRVLEAVEGATVPAHRVALVREVTTGLPLLVRTIAAMTAAGTTVDLLGPATVDAVTPVLTLQFDRLMPESRDVVSALALCSSDAIDVGLFVTATATPEDAVWSAIDDAVRHGVIDNLTLKFRHDLIRRHALARLQPSRRINLHRALANAMGLPSWDRAAHRLAADPTRRDDETNDFVLGAARAAIEHRRPHAAIRLITELVPAENAGPSPTLAEATAVLAAAYGYSGDSERASEQLRRCVDHAIAAGVPTIAAHALLQGAVGGRSYVADIDWARQLRRVISACSSIPSINPDLLFQLQAEYVCREVLQRGLDDPVVASYVDTLGAAAGNIESRVARANVEKALLHVEFVRRDLEGHGIVDQLRRFGALARETGDFDLLSEHLALEGRHALSMGDRARWQMLNDEVETFTSASPRPVDRWARAAWRATACDVAGDARSALQHAGDALTIGRRYDCEDTDLGWSMIRLALSLQDGLEGRLRIDPQARSVGEGIIGLLVNGLELSFGGELPDANGTIESLVDRCVASTNRFQRSFLLTVTTQIALNLPGSAHASRLLPLWDEVKARFVVVGLTPVAMLGPVEFYRARLLARLGDEEAIAAFKQAHDHCAELGAPRWQAIVLEAHAQLLNAGNQIEASRRLREEARFVRANQRSA